jgi:type I restriction enzyme, S subunit
MNQNWESKTLNDVCENIFAGGDVPKNNFSKFKTDIFNIPIFANGIKNKGLYGFTNIKKVIVPSITVSARGTIGYSEIRKEPFFPIVRLIVLIPDRDKINLEFLKYIIENMDFKNSGTSIPQLTIPMIKTYEALIPKCLEEQKQIVEILDKAFESIEQAKVNIEKNIQNTKELFQSKLNEIFSQKGDGWEEKTLNQISLNLDNKRIPITKSKRVEGKIPYYGASGIVDYVKDYLFDEDLLLVSEDGANLLARTYPIAFSVSGKCWVNNHAHILKFENKINQKFVEYYLNSIKLDDYISGMAQPKLNQTKLNLIPIPYPTIDIQTTLIKDIDKLKEQTKQLEKQYQQKLDNLEELKKSILQKAFSGELIP